MPLWKNHHFVFQHLIFNSKDRVKSEENTEAYTKPQHKHEKQNEVRHTDMRNTSLSACFVAVFFVLWLVLIFSHDQAIIIAVV